MEIQNSSEILFNMLETNPIAPPDNFNDFVVGSIQRSQVKAIRLVDDLYDGKAVSQFKLVLGKNGNGKTLLFNMIKRHASEKNVSKKTQTEVEEAINVLFSHISAIGGEHLNIGSQIVENLQRSIFERAEITYHLIAYKMIEKFIHNYHPPFWLWIPGFFLKATLKRIIGDFKNEIGDFLNSVESGLFAGDVGAESVKPIVERFNEKLQKALARTTARKQFEAYAHGTELTDTLLKQFSSGGRVRPVLEILASLRNDLTNAGALHDPYKSVRVVVDIAQKVSCKLVIILIDDCNDEQIIDKLLPLVQSTANFQHSTKVLILASMVDDFWKEVKRRRNIDKGAQQRLEYSGIIEVKSPEKDEIANLLERLVNLYNAAYIKKGNLVKLSADDRSRIINECPISSFRSAIQYLTRSVKEKAKTI
jgi:hypothetical protein